MSGNIRGFFFTSRLQGMFIGNLPLTLIEIFY